MSTPAVAAASVAKKLVLAPKYLLAVRNFSAAKRAKASAELKIKKYEALIREGLGDETVGYTPGGVAAVRVMFSTNSRYDSTVLKERFPEAEVASKVTTAYSFLKTL